MSSSQFATPLLLRMNLLLPPLNSRFVCLQIHLLLPSLPSLSSSLSLTLSFLSVTSCLSPLFILTLLLFLFFLQATVWGDRVVLEVAWNEAAVALEDGVTAEITAEVTIRGESVASEVQGVGVGRGGVVVSIGEDGRKVVPGTSPSFRVTSTVGTVVSRAPLGDVFVVAPRNLARHVDVPLDVHYCCFCCFTFRSLLFPSPLSSLLRSLFSSTPSRPPSPALKSLFLSSFTTSFLFALWPSRLSPSLFYLLAYIIHTPPLVPELLFSVNPPQPRPPYLISFTAISISS